MGDYTAATCDHVIGKWPLLTLYFPYLSRGIIIAAFGGMLPLSIRRFNVLKSISLFSLVIIARAAAAVPPIPQGIFSMPAAETFGFPEQILNDPRIVGVDLGGSWAELEPSEGTYDWSSVDSELAKAESHGKKVLLRIVSGGLNVPGWLLADPNVQKFSFIDQNSYHSTYGRRLTIPVFWDPTFLAKKIALINAAGAHFSAHSSIEVVTCSFANSTTGDWAIPGEPEDIANWRAAGYSTDLMVNTGAKVIDATMAAFPNQNVALSIGRGAGDLDPTMDYLAETAVYYATTTYGRFITEKNALSAVTPDPAIDTSALFNWQVVFDQSPNVATQMLWFVTGDTTYRMNNGKPGDEAAVLLSAITIGTHYGAQYQEIYEADLKNPALSAVLDTANALLTKTPLPPAAPSSNTVTSKDQSTADLTWLDNADNELGYRVESKVGSDGTYELVGAVGPNLTTTTVGNLVEGKQYYFRLQAVNASGVSAYSNEESATTLLLPPNTLTAKATSAYDVILTWNDRSATETGFRIERSPVTDSNFVEVATVSANATSFTDSGLSQGTKYWYRVRAYNPDATSAYSNERQVTTLKDIPLPPSDLVTTSLLSNQVSLSWTDHSGNETNFKVQRKTGTLGAYTTIKTTAANIATYTDRDSALRDGTLYYYRVFATNSAGDSANSNEIAAVTVLAKPTSAKATALSSSRIDISWTDNATSETGYKIERKKTATGVYAEIARVGANIRSYSDVSGLEANTRYYYRVRATNGTADSAYSNEPSALTFR